MYANCRYSYHYPELYKLVPEQGKYVRCVQAIKDRKSIDDETKAAIQGGITRSKRIQIP